MKVNNKDLIICDSSDFTLLKQIFRMLVQGRSISEIKGKICKENSSVPEEYFEGAVGLLVTALKKRVRLVVNPLCFKELCFIEPTDMKQARDRKKGNINLLFKSGLFYLAWPTNAHQFATHVVDGVSKYNKVGALHRSLQYSAKEEDMVDEDLADKISCAENDEFYEKGGYLINLACHNYNEFLAPVGQENEIERRKEVNLCDCTRAVIQTTLNDFVFTPHQVICHVHRNNTDFGDKLTNTKTFEEINEVSSGIKNYSLGDLVRENKRVKGWYDAFKSGRVAIQKDPTPYTVVDVN